MEMYGNGVRIGTKGTHIFHSKKDNPSAPGLELGENYWGGSHFISPFEIRTTVRNSLPPNFARGDVGFRVVKEINRN